MLTEPLPGQKSVTYAPALMYTGRAVIDAVKQELVLMGVDASVEPDPSIVAKIAMDARRKFTVTATDLTIAAMDAQGEAWAATPAIHSNISNNQGRDGDDVVSVTSQDLSKIRRYEFLVNSGRWQQNFKRSGVLHLRVHNEATTVSLFTGIIDGIDYQYANRPR